MRNKVYLSLVHYPVYNRNKDIVCTSVTNFDIHDISRSCGTYEIKGYRLVVPVDAQKKLTERIIGYWQDGTGGQYNKDREQAFRVTDVAESIEAVVEEIERIEGQKPLIITTSARIFDNSISYENLSKQISLFKIICYIFVENSINGADNRNNQENRKGTYGTPSSHSR